MAFNNSCVSCSATSAFYTAKCKQASLDRPAGVPLKNNNTQAYLAAEGCAQMPKHKYHRAGGGMGGEIREVKEGRERFVSSQENMIGSLLWELNYNVIPCWLHSNKKHDGRLLLIKTTLN